MYCNPVAFEKTGLTTCLAAGAGSPRLTDNIKTGLFTDTSFEHQIIIVEGGGIFINLCTLRILSYRGGVSVIQKYAQNCAFLSQWVDKD